MSIMNKALLRATIVNLEAARKNDKTPIGFNLFDWCVTGGDVKDHTGHECNTVACIGGWIVLTAGWTPEDLRKMAREDSEEGINAVFCTARDVAGLTEQQAEDLFFGRFSGKQREQITTKAAIAAIRRLIRTGSCIQS